MNNRRRRSDRNDQMMMWDDDHDMFGDFRMMRDQMIGNFSSGFGAMQGFDRMFSDFGMEDMGFGDFNMQMSRPEREGNFISHSYSSVTRIGPDGRPIVEKRVKNKIGTRDRHGKQIIQEDEIYKNSAKGIKRVKKQKTLGNKKVEVTKEKIRGEKRIHRNIENMEEDDLEDFYREWKHKARSNKLPQLISSNSQKGRKKKRMKALKF